MTWLKAFVVTVTRGGLGVLAPCCRLFGRSPRMDIANSLLHAECVVPTVVGTGGGATLRSCTQCCECWATHSRALTKQRARLAQICGAEVSRRRSRTAPSGGGQHGER
jgi:hypothetical protein